MIPLEYIQITRIFLFTICLMSVCLLLYASKRSQEQTSIAIMMMLVSSLLVVISNSMGVFR